MSARPSPRDQIIGCLLGGAIGDCVGAKYEGLSDLASLIDDSSSYITDDTQLTLATCRSIIKNSRIDPSSIAEEMANLFRRGEIIGIGASTYKSLYEISMGVHWALAGRKGDRAAGNGAAMRIAPLAFLLDPGDRTQRPLLRDVCRITHHHDEAYAGALAIALAIRSVWKIPTHETDLLGAIAHELPDCLVRDRLLELSRLDTSTTIRDVSEQFGCSGYVVESVPFAIYSANQLGKLRFFDIIEAVIESGGDTDTNASMAGQIMGASIGSASLPLQQLDRIIDGKSISSEAQQFADLVIQITES